MVARSCRWMIVPFVTVSRTPITGTVADTDRKAAHPPSMHNTRNATASAARVVLRLFLVGVTVGVGTCDSTTRGGFGGRRRGFELLGDGSAVVVLTAMVLLSFVLLEPGSGLDCAPPHR